MGGKVRISSTVGGRLAVSGPLTFDSAGEACAAGLAALPPRAAAVFDLGDVSRADSAGLAVLVEWLREGRARGTRVTFENAPVQLRDLARSARLESVVGA